MNVQYVTSFDVDFILGIFLPSCGVALYLALYVGLGYTFFLEYMLTSAAQIQSRKTSIQSHTSHCDGTSPHNDIDLGLCSGVHCHVMQIHVH